MRCGGGGVVHGGGGSMGLLLLLLYTATRHTILYYTRILTDFLCDYNDTSLHLNYFITSEQFLIIHKQPQSRDRDHSLLINEYVNYITLTILALWKLRLMLL